MNGLNHQLRESVQGLLRAYATIVFLQKPWAGVLILGVSMLFPNIGLSGLLAAVTAVIVVRLLNFPYLSSGMHIYNSLLVGLSLGAFFMLDGKLVVLIILGAIIAIFLTATLSSSLWRYDALPVLSLPFVIVAMTLAFAARSFENLNAYLLPLSDGMLFSPQIDTFFSTLGAIYFLTNPLPGLVIFVLILLHSRYLALLAVSGFAVGYLLLQLLIGDMPPNLAAWSGFNFALTAMAIGGIFTIPGWASFVLAMVAAAISALITSAAQNLLFSFGLPVMAFPFLLTSLTVLAALRRRLSQRGPQLARLPDLPEVNYERARLARVRNGAADSIGILAPFFGEWDVYQGFDGAHTHKGEWRYALDFYMLEDGRSYSGEGERLDDYFCFGAPVVSPVYGTVVRINDSLKDNRPGDMDTQNNWGNFILIRLDGGQHILLAHLKQHSIRVKEKDRVEPGAALAECGNSGRSPQPHLHLQAQADALLGSRTLPFHLASVVVSSAQQTPSYRVIATPDIGDRVQPARDDAALANRLHLPVGRCLNYAWRSDSSESQSERRFSVDVNLAGEYRLHSNTGASAAFQENNGVLAFYDRTGPSDRLLDAWLLALGLTPLTEQAQAWRDAPDARLLPLSRWQKLLFALQYPLGGGLHSTYQRHWLADEKCWRQTAEHQVRLFGKTYMAHSLAVFDPQKGCTEFELSFGRDRYRAELVGMGLVEDQGIPGWQINDESST